MLRKERLSLRNSTHCLRQWPYHSKIPRTSAELNSHDPLLLSELPDIIHMKHIIMLESSSGTKHEVRNLVEGFVLYCLVVHILPL